MQPALPARLCCSSTHLSHAVPPRTLSLPGAVLLTRRSHDTVDEVRAALASRAASTEAHATVSAESDAGKAAQHEEELLNDPRLRRDAALRALYTELVLRGPLTPSEFWSQPELSAAAAPSSLNAASAESRGPNGISQVRGLPSTLPSARDVVVQPSSESAEHVQYELTPARVHQLFVTYAGLQRAYVRLVPAQMTEEQFWTRFFQSQHYRLRSEDKKHSSLKRERPEPSADSDVFALAQLEAAEAQARRDRLRHVLRDNDLTRDAEADVPADEREVSTSDAKLSAREYKRSARYQQQLELIRKVNRHAALLVESLAQDELAKPPAKRARLAKNENESSVQSPPASAPPSVPAPLAAASVSRDLSAAVGDESSSTTKWIRLPRLTTSSWALIPRVPHVRLTTSTLCAASVAVSVGTVSEFNVRRVHELLRHWWSAVRARDGNKLVRLRPALETSLNELAVLQDASATELRNALQRALDATP